MLLVNRFPPKAAQTCFCGRWRSANECVRIELRCESCLNCHLRSRSFFCDLSPESIEAFKKIKHAAVFPEHAVVLVEGQSPCGIFILCQGRAKLSTTSQLVGTSRETITRLLSEFRRNETAELKGSTLIIHNQPALKNMVRA